MKNKVQVTPPAARRALNEVEVMGKRAARGVGLPWGIAEEAGKAVRWLTALGFPGVEQLADILTHHDKLLFAELAPIDIDAVWQAPAGQLCPLIAGAALSDRAAEVAGGRVIELGPTTQPLLLAPYAAGAVRLTGTAMTLGWDDVVVVLTPDGVAIEGNHETLTARSTEGVRCHSINELAAPGNELAAPVDEPPALMLAPVHEPAVPAWDCLAAFAHRTFAPATEASRLSGAGAGLSDNN